MRAIVPPAASGRVARGAPRPAARGVGAGGGAVRRRRRRRSRCCSSRSTSPARATWHVDGRPARGLGRASGCWPATSPAAAGATGSATGGCCWPPARWAALMLVAVPLVPLWVLVVAAARSQAYLERHRVGLVRRAVGARGAARPAAYVGRGRRAASNAGFVLGPPLGALLVTWSYDAMFVVDGLAVIARPARAEPGAAARTRPTSARRRARRPRPPAGRCAPTGRWWCCSSASCWSTSSTASSTPRCRSTCATPASRCGSTRGDRGRVRADPAAGDPGDPVAAGPRGARRSSPSATRWSASGRRCSRCPSRSVSVLLAMVVLTAGEILYKTTATAHVLDQAPDHLVGQYQGLYTGAATSGTLARRARSGRRSTPPPRTCCGRSWPRWPSPRRRSSAVRRLTLR